MHQRAVLAGECFWGMQDLIRKLPGVVLCRDVSPGFGANDELLDYTDTQKPRELYLAWCGENGFEPIAIGAAA
jgi:peptide methionine sulfoxide reductase MsrA